LSLQFEILLQHWPFSIFYPFIGNFCDFILTSSFTEEEEGGSALLGLVFVHQRLGLYFGSCALRLIEEKSLIAGPMGQVK